MMKTLTLLGCLFVASAYAAPRTPFFTMSGELRDGMGNPVEGPIGITVRLYANETGGAAFHTELFLNVAVKKGELRLLVGSVVPLDLSKFAIDAGTASIWVGLQVLGEGEMAPRVRLTSAPWAFR
jgi:hypothetical protein